MKVNKIFKISVERAKKWHNGNINEWSALEWAGAMCGEAGEAANAAKKLKRLEGKIKSINKGSRNLKTIKDAQIKVEKECADTIFYSLLLMARVNTADPMKVLKEVFNKKSEEYGFPERLK